MAEEGIVIQLPVEGRIGDVIAEIVL